MGLEWVNEVIRSGNAKVWANELLDSIADLLMLRGLVVRDGINYFITEHKSTKFLRAAANLTYCWLYVVSIVEGGLKIGDHRRFKVECVCLVQGEANKDGP